MIIPIKYGYLVEVKTDLQSMDIGLNVEHDDARVRVSFTSWETPSWLTPSQASEVVEALQAAIKRVTRKSDER